MTRKDNQHKSFLPSPTREFDSAQEVVSTQLKQDPSGTYTEEKAQGYEPSFTTTATLDSGESFTSGIIDLAGYTYLEIETFSDKNGQGVGQWYHDDEETVMRSFTAPYLSTRELAINGTRTFGRYLKYTYTNTSDDDQTVMHLKVKLTNVPMTGALFKVDDFIPTNILAQVTRSVLVGLDEAGVYQNVGVNDVGALNTSSFLLDVARGRYPSYEIGVKFGRNPETDTGTSPEDVWSGGGTYTGMPITGTEDFLEVLSSSASDTAAGVGARTVEITGLDINYNMVNEVVVLNGTTPVLTINKYWRSSRVKVLTGGTTGHNVGNITTRWESDNAVIFAVLPTESNQDAVCADTVPANKTRILTNIFTGISRASGAAGSANHRLLVREIGGVFRAIRNVEVTTGSPFNPNANPDIVIPEKADIKWQVHDVSDNNTISTAQFEYVDIEVESFLLLETGFNLLLEDGEQFKI